MDDDEKRLNGYVQNEDGTWRPTPEKLRELIRRVHNGLPVKTVKLDWRRP